MKNKGNLIKILIISSVSVLLCLIAVSVPGKGQRTDDKNRQIEDGEKKKNKKTKRVSAKKKSRVRDLNEKNAKRNTVAGISEESVEREDLTEEQSRILESIQQAFDNEDKAALLRIVQGLQQTKGWPTAFPLQIRQEAIDAIAWFGYDCLPEAVLFLDDPNEDVVQAVTKMFEDAVENEDLGDEKRANVLSIASDVLKDADVLESMLFELNNMRNSIAVDVLKKLLKCKNPTTLKLLPETISSFTGEENVDTPEKLDAWLRENPDDEE